MPAGQPTKYRKHFKAQAAKLCELGATNPQLAEFFDVSISTITQWLQTHKEFSTAVKKGRSHVDAQVEKSLYQRALGYSHPDVHISTHEGRVIVTDITKHYPPSEVACIFWLKNRKPAEWREKQEVTVQNPDGSNLIPQAIIDAAAKLAKTL